MIWAKTFINSDITVGDSTATVTFKGDDCYFCTAIILLQL